jgi:hypothetical protein
LFVLGGVVVEFGASSFGCHTGLFFFGGVGTTFGAFFFCHLFNFLLLQFLLNFFILFHRPIHHLRLDMDLP